MTDQRKELEYYKAAVLKVAPLFVPSRVLLLCRVRGDGPFAATQAGPGETDCESNRWGAISVRADNGEMLGVRPVEFQPIAWRENV